MGKVTKAKEHLTVQEIQDRIRETVGFPRVLKWLVVLNALVDPRPANEIALHLNLATQTVHNIVSQYNNKGPDALDGPGKGGRYKAYLSLQEEAEFLEPFQEQALTGKIATAMEIKAKLEGRLGHSVHKTTVYRMLKRHGWRKIVPRTVHVQSDAKQQEDFKKNSRTL
ncbi:Transposase [Desulfatibacillum alkenivorans DSM 16219]|jgi:transposase|uniref:Transposase n=2 Tax=Desulfatibacillum alkenivorans TaxID=259354 RepID=A0A1M6Z0U9_9BACT|nr:winged helix-turn-helix domain-containing protein [Desulfatibacillum alkenivorans]SHL19255.1 Transposase [Desulfatibacillum alkenivorans DSM 16219]SHL24057.1 Transposase [Desulfatibacillum alkenivorans DSM 16219]